MGHAALLLPSLFITRSENASVMSGYFSCPCWDSRRVFVHKPRCPGHKLCVNYKFLGHIIAVIDPWSSKTCQQQVCWPEESLKLGSSRNWPTSWTTIVDSFSRYEPRSNAKMRALEASGAAI